MTDTAKGAGEIVEDLLDLHQWALKLGNESELGPLNTFKRMTATLIERVSAQSAELEQLRAQNARLKAPVSKREWADALRFAPSIYITDVERATRIIKDRAQEPRKESNDASS